MKRGLLNGWIAALVMLLVIDACPSGIEGHKRVEALIDPLLKTSGLWQGSWRLFAPNPDHINTWIEADVHLADGSHVTWTTPNWQQLSWFDKRRFGRHIKLSNNLRLDKNRRVWPAVAQYVARVSRIENGAPPMYVTLTRRWWNLPSPDRYASELDRYGRLPPSREDYPQRFVFHRQVVP